MAKIIQAICEHCGVSYVAERKSSKYHSDACRVAAHRAKQKVGKNFDHIFTIISGLAKELKDERFGYDAACILNGFRQSLDANFPPKTRWWACGNCGKSVLVFIPNHEHCGCGHDAKWYVRVL